MTHTHDADHPRDEDTPADRERLRQEARAHAALKRAERPAEDEQRATS